MSGRRSKRLRALALREHAKLLAAGKPSPGVGRLYHAGMRAAFLGDRRSA